ncbi:MAG TPA: hypothetical protein PK297_00260 [Spirochaetota bacterium]|nr:hypothetical protein [Spirochaetota bacterium]
MQQFGVSSSENKVDVLGLIGSILLIASLFLVVLGGLFFGQITLNLGVLLSGILGIVALIMNVTKQGQVASILSLIAGILVVIFGVILGTIGIFAKGISIGFGLNVVLGSLEVIGNYFHLTFVFFILSALAYLTGGILCLVAGIKGLSSPKKSMF